LPEAIVPKVGHGPKLGQNGFDRGCVSVVFLSLLCFIVHSNEANGGTDMKVLACFRPGFFCGQTKSGEKSWKKGQLANENQLHSFIQSIYLKTISNI